MDTMEYWGYHQTFRVLFDKAAIGALCPFSQDVFLQFPSTRLGKFRYYLDLSRHHKFADAACMFRPFDDIFALELLACLDRDKCFGSFTPMRICHSDHSCFENIRVSCEHGF